MAVRKIAFLGLLCVGFPLHLDAGSIPPSRPPKLGSAAALVKDQHSGEILMSKQADVAMPIASITKLMTAMVVLDSRPNMNEILTIEEVDKDTLRNSTSHLSVGTRLTRREALLVALLASENRAAHALGRTYHGGVPALVKAMNEKARALELSETRFDDPTGLSDGNVSTAQDLSLLVNAAYGYSEIRACTTTGSTTLLVGRRQVRFLNTNALVRNRRWQIGLSKTGYIEEGGRCLVMQTQLAKRPILIVLLHSVGKNTRIGDANRIKHWLEGNKAIVRKQSAKGKKQRSAREPHR